MDMKRRVLNLIFVLLLLIPVCISDEGDPSYLPRPDKYTLEGTIATPIEMREMDGVEITFCDDTSVLILNDMNYNTRAIKIQMESDVYDLLEGGVAVFDINGDGKKEVKVSYMFAQKGEAKFIVEGLESCNNDTVVSSSSDKVLTAMASAENSTIKATKNFFIKATSSNRNYFIYILYGVLCLLCIVILINIKKVIGFILIPFKKIRFNKKSSRSNMAVRMSGEHIACPKCGRDTIQGDKFCINCGEKTREKKKFCVTCGIELRKESKFCPECGEKTNY